MPVVAASKDRAVRSKSCFIIGPIGEEGSDTRRRADQVIRHVINPVLSERGYSTIQRADQFGKPGVISNQIITEIINADLAVADLTGHNPNVFYELGVRHAFKKNVVMIYERKAPIPFDVAGMRGIALDITDPDSIEQAKKDLAEQVDAIHGGAKVESPVSVATEILSMARSNKPVDQAIANLSRMVEELRAEVRSAASRPPNLILGNSNSLISSMPDTLIGTGQDGTIWSRFASAQIVCEICKKEIPPHQLMQRTLKRCDDHMLPVA